MAVQELDIIQQIKAAEDEAKRLIAAAEAEGRERVAQAEAAAAVRIEQIRQRLHAELIEALNRAEAEARAQFEQMLFDAQQRAMALEHLAEERRQQAVNLLIKKVREKWQ
jgi:vacuolar-type H+-ATPase subunit H